MGRRMGCEPMGRETRSGGDVGCHLTRHLQLALGCQGKDGDYQVLQRYHARVQSEELSIGHLGMAALLPAGVVLSSGAFIEGSGVCSDMA